MERHLALPIAFAAAFHAALLFGIPRTVRTVVPASTPPDVIGCTLLPPPEPESEPEPEPGYKEKAASPDKPVITSAEPTMIISESAFEIQRPLPEIRPMVDSNNIPAILSGFDDGINEGTRRAGFIKSIDLDNPPRTRFQPSPVYPFEGKKDALRGEVLVEFRVDESGRVNDARVIRSSHRMFEDPTLRAVARWQFEPGRRAGRIVSFKMALPVIFNIED